MDWRVEDDGGPEVVYAEESPGWSGIQPQALWVRVGPVLDDGAERDELGIWVQYQQAYFQSDLQGPVLLTPQAWRELNAAVEKRLQRGREAG